MKKNSLQKFIDKSKIIDTTMNFKQTNKNDFMNDKTTKAMLKPKYLFSTSC